MVIEPSLFSQQPSGGRTCVIFLPRPDIPHGSGLTVHQTGQPTMSTLQCLHTELLPLNPSRSSTISSSSCKLVPGSLHSPVFASPALKLRETACAQQIRQKNNAVFTIQLGDGLSSCDVSSAVLEVSGKSMAITAIAHREFASLLFPCRWQTRMPCQNNT